MAGRVSRIGRVAAMLLVVSLASGCASIVNHRGYIADELLLRSVEPGIDNRQSVEKTLGRPSFSSQFGPQVWYYTGSNTKQAPFTAQRIYQHAVFAVHFDQAGNVAKVDRTGIDLVARISPESDKTPTLGRERGFLEDLFGNIGAVSTAGGGAGGGGGGGGG